MMRLVKSAHAVLVVMAGILLILGVIAPARVLPGPLRRHVRERTMMYWARWMTTALRISRVVDGLPPAGNAMVVVNHVSWIDILVLMATHRGIFLAKSELAKWPLIGWMCRQTDTLFLRRNNPRSLAEKVATVTRALASDETVILFPEGTTTTGGQVLPFFPGLFQAAIDAGTPVQPVALQYLENNRASGTAPFVGDDDFRAHFGQLLQAGPITAKISFLLPVESQFRDRRQLARDSQRVIAQQLATRRAA